MIHNLYNTICDLKHLKLEWLRIKNIYRFTIFMNYKEWSIKVCYERFLKLYTLPSHTQTYIHTNTQKHNYIKV